MTRRDTTLPLTGFGWREAARAVQISVLAMWAAGRCASELIRSRHGLTAGAAEAIVDLLERLGPTFVKVGQLIASSDKIFPPALSDACRRCLDQAKPITFSTVTTVVQEDLGSPLLAVFREFDPEPQSCASIAQVHACVLIDGRCAVMKVRRPGIVELMNADLRILYQLSRLASRSRRLATANLTGMITDLHKVTNDEVDFGLEARRQRHFRANLHAFGDNDAVTAPEVYLDYCGPRTVCMERMSGRPIDLIEDSPARFGVDPAELLRATVKAWMEAACLHGPFHGDVHAGNIWILDDGRACFLDFGIMGELPPPWRRFVVALLSFGTATTTPDFVALAREFSAVGLVPTAAMSETDAAVVLSAALAPAFEQTLGDIDLGQSFKGLLDMFDALGAEFPSEMILVTKQLLYFDRYSKQLAPGWQMIKDRSLWKNFASLGERVGAQRYSPGSDETIARDTR